MIISLRCDDDARTRTPLPSLHRPPCGGGIVRILALEASTTSAKALLFDADTGTMRVRSRRFEVSVADAAVRDGDSIYIQLMALGREVAAGSSPDLVVLIGTWHGLVLTDDDLRTVTPVMEWPYTGARTVGARLRADEEFTRWFYRRTGCMVNAAYPAFKLRHLLETGAQIEGRTVLDQASLIFARMTGRVWSNPSLASGSGLLNAEAVSWDSEVLERLGLTGVVLPELSESTDTAPLLPEAAGLLGIPSGIPVLVPGPDGGLNQIGDLAIEPGEMTLSMGTSGALRFSTPSPSFSESMSTWSYRSPLGPLSGAATSGCGNCVDWARDRFFDRSADFSEIEPQLSDDRRDLPVFLPFLFGERSPGWQDQRRGGFAEMLPAHTNIDLYQSVLEGIVYSLVHCFAELRAVNGDPSRIVLSGGVLSSPFWTQMTVDALGQPVEVSARQHSSITGALRMGLLAYGHDPRHPSLDGVTSRVIEPREERRSQYVEGFERYLEHYERSRPVGVRR